MDRRLQWLAAGGGLCLGVFAVAAAASAWLGERSFAAAEAAKERGNLTAAAAAYGAAAARGHADAAVEGARLLLALRDWEGAAAALRAAGALVPARGYPHLLRAQLELSRPGEWDRAREERVREACRLAVALEPTRSATWEGCAGNLLRLYATRREVWEQTRALEMRAELLEFYGGALERRPRGARQIFEGLLGGGGSEALVLEIAARSGSAAVLAEAEARLAARKVSPGTPEP